MANDSFFETLSTLMGIAILGSTIYAWWYFYEQRKSGISSEPYVRRLPVPWGIVDLFVVLVIYVGLQFVAGFLVLGPDAFDPSTLNDLSTDEQMPMMLMFSAASLLTVLFSTIVIRLRTAATFQDFGMTPPKWISDLKSGALVFAMIIVPIFALQWCLQLLADEPSHPLVKMLLEESSPAFFLSCAFVAIIAAPIVEEFLFRVLLQGWLENLTLVWSYDDSPLSEDDRKRFIVGGVRTPIGSTHLADAEKSSGTDGVAEEISVENRVPRLEDVVNPYSPPKIPRTETVDEVGKFREASDPDKLLRPSRWPIIISSGVFALAHLGHGTDPIPLFFFSLGLGWLYQRTHRMWPGVVVHMMLNGLSMLQLLLYLQLKTP